MTYAQSSTIEAADYNKLAWGSTAGGSFTNAMNNIAIIWGNGYGRQGYGQSTSSITQVAAGSTVTAPQWTGLLNTVNNVLGHQGGSGALISPTSVTSGSAITYYSSINTGLATANANAITGTVATTTAGSSLIVSSTASWGAGTSRTGRFQFTFTWISADVARFWWNAGGKLQFTFAIPAGGTTRNNDWNALATACGAITLGYNNTTKTGGSGTPNILLNSNNGGYWVNTTLNGAHPGVQTTQFRQYDANSPYTSDNIYISTIWTGSTSNGGFSQLVVLCDWNNAYSSPFQQAITNTGTTTAQIINPAGSYLSSFPPQPSLSGVFADL